MSQIPSPEQTFGFRMGEDRKLVNWQQIVSYFEMLDEASPRLKLVEIGRTTLDRTMVMAVIGSAQSVANLHTLMQIQELLARPYNLTPSQAGKVVEKGKVVFLITMNIHSTEIASSQGAVELAYELVTRTDSRTQQILDNLLILLIPSLNPDGQDMVSKWYSKDLGTQFEGSRMPMKYHHYADHDNNRDWYFFNLVESQNVAKVLYHDWYPEVILDHHQMENDGPRFFLPPYADPINPNIAPALMATVNMFGQHAAADMYTQGLTGIATNARFNAFFQGTLAKTPLWHNRIGLLTEAAGVRLATPLFLAKSGLGGLGDELPDHSRQSNFLAPWQGGWWRLRDVVEYQMAATWSMLELAATYKNKVKQNFYNLNLQAIHGGNTKSPAAYIVPIEQHDPNSAIELIRRMRLANIDVYQSVDRFMSKEGVFRRGDFIIPLAQPGRAYVKDMFERQEYPGLHDYPGGPPKQPYDMTAWTLPLQMGVKVVEIEKPFEAGWQKGEPHLNPDYSNLSAGWIAIERRFIHGYKLLNRLLKDGHTVFVLNHRHDGFERGTLVLEVAPEKLKSLCSLAGLFDVPMARIAKPGQSQLERLRSQRIAVYQPWLPWIYDEGWLRFVLDTFGFDYTTVHNVDIRSSRIAKKHDILIFASQDLSSIVDGRSEDSREGYFGEPEVRKHFTGGIREEGIERVLQFMQDGGTVIFIGEACELACERLSLPVENALRDASRQEFFAPGCILDIKLDSKSALTFGMETHASAFFDQPVALRLKPYHAEIREVAEFTSKDRLLQSGWLVGSEKLAGQVAIAEIPVGEGRAILYGFRVHHRGQTYGTFKLLFNALYKSETIGR